MSEKLELIPVEDIKVTKGMTVDDMLRAMGRAGGFTAQKLADATDIAQAMITKKGCLRILSFPACIMATGTRGVIVDMVKNHMVDLIITTCGTLDHDLSRTFAAYYKGDFMMDDAMLRDEYEISRLGNVLVPDACYGIVLEDELLPMFDEIFEGKDSMTTMRSSTRSEPASTTRTPSCTSATRTTCPSSSPASPTDRSDASSGCTTRPTGSSGSTCSATSRCSPR